MILACLFRRAAWRVKVVAAMLAACWLWVAWAFLAERYATINWAASYFAIGFAIEALLLLWVGVVRADLACTPAARLVHIAGICMFLFALIVQPLIGPMLGRPWLQVQIFEITPDPTVVATLGILLLAGHSPPLVTDGYSDRLVPDQRRHALDDGISGCLGDAGRWVVGGLIGNSESVIGAIRTI